MIEEIKEPISVVASFINGKMTPLVFSWHGRKYERLQITSHWTVMEGQFRMACFSLFDGANVYEIRFHPRFYTWELLKIQSD